MFIFHRTRAHFHRLPRGPCADARSPTLGHSVFLYDGHSRIQLTGLLILYQGLDDVDVTGLTMIKTTLRRVILVYGCTCHTMIIWKFSEQKSLIIYE